MNGNDEWTDFSFILSKIIHILIRVKLYFRLILRTFSGF